MTALTAPGYGMNYADVFLRAPAYVSRILKGEKPADLSVQMPTKFELVINLRTAKVLSLNAPAVCSPARMN